MKKKKFDLKEFLRPTLWKIIIFIIIFVIFVPFIYLDTGIRCIQAPCPSGKIGSILFYLLQSKKLHLDGLYYFGLIIGLIVSYLLSCLIFRICGKKVKK